MLLSSRGEGDSAAVPTAPNSLLHTPFRPEDLERHESKGSLEVFASKVIIQRIALLSTFSGKGLLTTSPQRQTHEKKPWYPSACSKGSWQNL